MAINPYSQKDRLRLFQAVKSARKDLEWMRKKRMELISQFVGKHFGDQRGMQEVLVNLLSQTASYYTTALAYERPRYLISTHDEGTTSFTKRYQLALNNYVSQIGLDDELAMCVLDAFFSFGIAKVFVADSPYLHSKTGEPVDTGRPLLRRISPDDWIHDSKQKRWDECRFMGDAYSVPFAKLKEDDLLYDQAEVKKVVARSKYPMRQEQAQEITQGHLVDHDELEPMVDLLDLYLPEEDRWVTFALKDYRSFDVQDTAPLSESRPGHNPYPTLSFQMVPDSTVPLPPAYNLIGLHRLFNNLVNKLGKQAKRQKQINIYPGSDEDFAKRAKRAEDGEWIPGPGMNVDGVKMLEMWGPNNLVQAFGLGVREMFNEMSGNLRLAQGLGADAPTATQSAMLAQNIGNTEQWLRGRVNKFAALGGRLLGNLLWDDPAISIPGQDQVPGTGITVKADWTPGHRQGRPEDYLFSVEPYSMQFKDPQQRLAALEQRLLNIWIPLEQSGKLAQAGYQMDVETLIELQAELDDMPRLRQLIKLTGMDPSLLAQQPGGAGGSPSPDTGPNEYIRHNATHQGPGAQSREMQSLLSGAGAAPQGPQGAM